MIGELFQTRITSFKSVRKNSVSRQELKFRFESTEQVQDFLESYDKEFKTSLIHPLTSDKIEWNSINYKLLLPYFKISFDEIVIDKADVVNIKITRKETHDSEMFIYEITILKPSNPEIDAVITDVYLNRKECDDNDKEVFVLYDTEFERCITKVNDDEDDETF